MLQEPNWTTCCRNANLDRIGLVMNNIEFDELREIISRLDEGIPKDGAQVKLAQYGGGPDEGVIVGNQQGYLRLGVEFLKAAIVEHVKDEGDNEKTISVDLEYLIAEDSSINFDWFERTEEIPVEEHKYRSTWKERLIPLCVLSILAGILILAAVGLVAVIIWLR